MTYSIKHIKDILNAQLNHECENEISHVAIDSRSLDYHEKTLFFCLEGDKHDGHDYINELVSKGVKNFVVAKAIESNKNMNVLIVEDTKKALQQLAKYHRNQYHLPVLAITGSNGKTIVKEWINFLISPEYQVVRSPKSFNSQIGVPLSLLTFNQQHQFGIIEAGISQIKEMDALEDIIQPTIGLLTNIGSAHDEGFDNREEKINEKLKLFKNIETFIGFYNKDILGKLSPQTKTYTWSFENKNANLYIKQNKNNDSKNSFSSFIITENNENHEIKLPFSDQASVQNAFHAISLMRFLNYGFETIAKRVLELYPLNMRLELKQGINNTLLLDDSYSADYHSLKIALDTLENLKQHQTKTVILSDIFQSGKNENDLYESVYQLLKINQINRIFVIGDKISSYFFGYENIKAFKNLNEFLLKIDHLNFQNESILIKGARIFAFEKIVHYLQIKEHETRLEINLNAISHNYHYYKSKLKKSTKIMAMIKAFGYGNGGVEIAKELIYQKVDYLGVAFADEGILLRNNQVKVPIMVLNPEINTFEKMLQYDLEPEIYNLRGLTLFSKLAKDYGKTNYPIHIKIDTGMHRLGFDEFQIADLIKSLNNYPHLKVVSILSHLVASDNQTHFDFTINQCKKFEEITENLSINLGYQPMRHILNTSGISNFNDYQFDMVRLGLGIYGVSNDLKDRDYLQLVGTLKSTISQIKEIKASESVSYNRSFIANKNMKIATIPIGYADGVRRVLGNENSYVIIQAHEAKIVGTICMDMMMVDVTEINCNEGDEVVIFGNKPTLYEIAEKANTITYEIMAGISSRVKRIFYRE